MVAILLETSGSRKLEKNEKIEIKGEEHRHPGSGGDEEGGGDVDRLVEKLGRRGGELLRDRSGDHLAVRQRRPQPALPGLPQLRRGADQGQESRTAEDQPRVVVDRSGKPRRTVGRRRRQTGKLVGPAADLE